VVKEDRATLTVTGNNPYVGNTSVTGGSLVAGPGTTIPFGTGTISVSGSILAPSVIAAAEGARIENPITMGSLAIRAGTVPSGAAILAGTGFIRSAGLSDSGMIAPGDAVGNATGSLAVGNLTFAGGSTYEWNVASPGDFDRVVLNGTGTGSVTATPASPFVIRIVSLAAPSLPGPATGFGAQVYDWEIVTGNLAGFSPTKVFLDTSRFSCNAGSGQFAVSQTATGLHLTFTPDGLGASPRIAVAPNRVLAAGNRVVFTASADTQVSAYRWFRNGALIAGAVGAQYTIEAATVADAGAYAVEITGPGGTSTSNPADLTVTPTRLSALSVRSVAGAGSNTLVAGLVVNGTSRKDIIVRAIGPSLALPQYGSLTGVLSQTSLSLFTSGSTQAFLPIRSLRWSGDPAVIASASRVGLAPLAAPSDDSVFTGMVAPGVYTTQVTNQLPGLALMEVYDLGTAADRSRMTALSVRSSVGSGDQVLIVGFVVSGTAPLRLVLRGLGPALVASGISGTLADPLLGIYSGSALVASNNDWGGGAALASAFAGVGLPALPVGSTDAALLVTLPPGVYTAQLSGVAGGTGVGLLEIYEAP
jgi:autotransporter-associated beta strand protein